MLSFSGETSQGEFWQQILDRKKTQTCRKPRKHRIWERNTLFLYWKVRVPKNKKKCHFIGVYTCTKVTRMCYRDFAFDDAFARRDGFKDAEEMREWFGDPLEQANDVYDVIEFIPVRKGANYCE